MPVAHHLPPCPAGCLEYALGLSFAPPSRRLLTHPSPALLLHHHNIVVISIDGGARELKSLACEQSPVSDKFDQHNYELMYGLFLLPLRSVRPPPKILEIGLGCNMRYGAGASARLWRRIFPEAELWFADVDAACVEKHMHSLREQRIHALVGSQANASTLRQWVAQSSGGFHAIIDDGSHFNSHILTTFDALWPTLRPGGVYFIEDLQLGRHTAWDDTRGAAVFSDIMQSWVDQKLIGYRDGPHANWFEARWDTAFAKNFAAHAANDRARAARAAHPLPRNVSFIFCQEEACAIGKEGRHHRRRAERRCRKGGVG
ncbi:hypothetical protein AB1Y20_016294 [Prymnesium parvum]|uniref:Rhamnosyl O-methyltransferase n=1 Tax=Prymnesium parvum TaxID=97485 RepID=A0AB34IG01_PRYPA